MEDETSYEPNYPRGYRYKPWTIDQIVSVKMAGMPVDLGGGDWD